jgi:signal transduction histidine kinase
LDENRLMGNEQLDPRWPKLLSLAVHEFRTPITVVAGYLRMVLKERAGPISDQQRKLLEEAEKSCGRLSALVAEMSDLSALESGKATLNRAPLDLSALLREEVAALPELPDRSVSVVVEGADSPIHITGDATRLRAAFSALLTALRREVVSSDRLITRVRHGNSGSSCLIAMGEPEKIENIEHADVSTLAPFDEWRGGSGLSLPVARRVFTQHGGSLLGAPGEEKAGAVLVLPVK